MIDLTKISDEVIIARGQFTTVRGAHEELQKMCGALAAIANQVLRGMTDKDSAIDMDKINGLLEQSSAVVANISVLTKQINSLANQRAEIKAIAWQ